MLHFRIGTSGKIDLNNCHPFTVNNNLAFVHNGIINSIELTNINYSDTWHFNKLLKQLPNDFLNNKAITELLSNYIEYSKLIFLDNKGAFKIINEDLGHWNNNNWFSNNSYKTEKYSFKKYNNTHYFEAENYCSMCGEIILKDDKYCSECLEEIKEYYYELEAIN